MVDRGTRYSRTYRNGQHLIDKFWRPDIALLVGAMTLSAAIFGINAITLDNLREDTFRSPKRM